LLRGEMNEQRQVNKAEITAREGAAQLRGQVEAMQAQIADLVRLLGERQGSGVEAAKSASKTPKQPKGAHEVDNQAKLI